MRYSTLTEEINKFKKLSGIQLISEQPEEQFVDAILSKVMSGEEDAFLGDIGRIGKVRIKPSYYNSLMVKDGLTAEEQNIVQTINQKIVSQLGVGQITNILKQTIRGLDTAQADYVVENFLGKFDSQSAGQIKAALTPAPKAAPNQAPPPNPQTTTSTFTPPPGATTPPPSVTATGVLTPPQIQQTSALLNKSISEVMNLNITLGELSSMEMADIKKLQQLMIANKRLMSSEEQQLLNEKIQQQITAQQQMDNIAAQDAKLATQGNKLDVKQKRLQLRKQYLGLLTDTKWKRILLISIVAGIAAYKMGGKGIVKAVWNWLGKDGSTPTQPQPAVQPQQVQPPTNQQAGPKKLKW